MTKTRARGACMMRRALEFSKLLRSRAAYTRAARSGSRKGLLHDWTHDCRRRAFDIDFGRIGRGGERRRRRWPRHLPARLPELSLAGNRDQQGWPEPLE